MTVHFWEIKNKKSSKMGRQKKKKLEKISKPNNIKTTYEYVYNLISYR